MNKPVSRQAHGFTGYIYIPYTAYTPEMVGFTRNKMATQFCKLSAAGILTSSIFTRAEWYSSRKCHLKII